MRGHRNLGGDGTFPHGKLQPDDEGQIRFAVAADHVAGLVRVDFGDVPVVWLAMLPANAREIAHSLLKMADEIDAVALGRHLDESILPG
ncbi:MAG: hypothetical protein ABSG29_13300 [Steroidobacteraceae bacterium]